MKPSDLSILQAYLGEAEQGLIATVKGAANDIFYSKLESWGLASAVSLTPDLPPQSLQALKNTKTFSLTEEGRAEIAPLMEIALNTGDPPSDSIVSAEAIEILKQNAAQGNAVAQRKLGLLYENGAGVEQSYAEALAWYQKAADLGDRVAHNNIGVMHFAGFGVPRNLDEAIKWFLRAADLGSAGAMDNIGEMYSRGLGVAPNQAEALKWFRKAAELGHAAARNKLEQLSPKDR
ncbi:MAG: tetratricopeptide repeat protein [Deltaproteobacteria bacterium]